MAKLIWRGLLGLFIVFAMVMGEMSVRGDEWGSENIAQSPAMLPRGNIARKSKIFDHPKVSMVDDKRRTNGGGGRGWGWSGEGGGGGGDGGGEWGSGNIAPSPAMLPHGGTAEKSEIFNHPKVNMVDDKRWTKGGGGGGGGGWGWGGEGGGGGGGGGGGRGGGGGGSGGGGMGGAGGWGWGGGGGGWWAWGCRKQSNRKEGRHHHHNWHNGKNGEYKLGEFAQCMGSGRCRGMRLDCPLHCGGPCLYDCIYMCKAHCRRS